MSFTISETAELTGVSAHTLRYYERDGLMLAVERSATGHRRYSEREVAWIDTITRLRGSGMPIRDVRRYAELARRGAGTEDERLEILERHRARVRTRLAELAEHLESVDAKVAYFRGERDTCD